MKHLGLIFFLVCSIQARSMPWEIRLTIAESRLFENLLKGERENAAQAFWEENYDYLREETKSWKFLTPATRILKWQGMLADNRELLDYLQGFLYAWMIARTTQNPLVINGVRSIDEEAANELKSITRSSSARNVTALFKPLEKWVKNYPEAYQKLQEYAKEAKRNQGRIPSLVPKREPDPYKLTLNNRVINNPNLRERYIQDHMNYTQKQSLQNQQDEAVNQAVSSRLKQVLNQEIQSRVNQYMVQKVRNFQGPFADQQRAYARSAVEEKVRDGIESNLKSRLEDQIRNEMDRVVRERVEIEFLRQMR